jgi:alkylation response protein AidB-like acyl-CoA dehydrogenase
VDFEMGREAANLRHDLRQLVKAHVPEDFLGAFTDDTADLEVAQEFCRLLAERGLLCMSWPEEFGGRGSSAWEQTVVRPAQSLSVRLPRIPPPTAGGAVP